MKRNMISSLIVISVLFSHGFSIEPISSTCLHLTQGYVMDNLSSMGYSHNIMTHPAFISSSNPASVIAQSGISIGLSYQFESEVDPAMGPFLRHKRNQIKLPQSFGLIFPLKKLSIGLSFNQEYNSIQRAELELITIENPTGSGEYVEFRNSENINSYTLSISSSFPGIITESDMISCGLQLDLKTLEYSSTIFGTSSQLSTYGYGWKLGLKYEIKHDRGIGIYFENNPRIKDNITYDGLELNPIEIDSIEVHGYPISPPSHLEGKMPDRLTIGFFSKLTPKSSLTFDFTNVYWSQLSSNNNDYIDVSGTLLFQPINFLSFSVGILSTGRAYKTDYLDLNSKLHGVYLFTGLGIDVQSFNIGLSYAFSSFDSGDYRDQKIGKIQIGYTL
ncbi:MAG: hypothetical protein HOF29_13060 [Candidatus Marinimicrobia bacterium]|nr:hypothetical protein [Candidatus Neomarinimicrobiota bacterium]MBT3760943.1 hypothetical protein [Candidatus Neomarinimicrobiota bacterium]MBT3896986.1 hypothetical protein [Candidatus Neomarinimicrobiota bacterium]MBT4173955.1 hypothetical protein [Candidatus Neomarinimicrobiota bacterium]MBT4538637.1 hypothetical protein [Candidatus Neomarinimicrobiota bacterium]